MREKHKKIVMLFISTIIFYSAAIQAEIKTLVDAQILEHGNVLGNSAVYPPTDRVVVGDPSLLQGNMALLHAQEVAQIINDTAGEGAQLMEECCWRPQPSVYSNFVVATTQDILSTGNNLPFVFPPEQLYNPDDAPDLKGPSRDLGRPMIGIPTTFGEHMVSVFSQMVRIRDNFSIPAQLDGMDRFTYEWMSTLTTGIPAGFNFTSDKLPPDSLASRLVWNWSYEGKKYRQYREGEGSYSAHPNAYLDNFRDYYSWACVVCLGAGFYDTLGMYDQQADGTYTANEYYTAIVSLLSQDQQTWLANQFAEGFRNANNTADAPPLQVSLGLTMQSQQTNNPTTVDSDATYGTHCHSAAEVYIPIDAMALDKKYVGNVFDSGDEGHDYVTDSYMAGYPNTSDATPTFGDFTSMQSQVDSNLTAAYTTVTNGDLIYWDKLLEHSMFPGQRFQFSAWARIDRPWEGTYFPDDIDLVDETRDIETGVLYSQACVPQVTATSSIYCGKDISLYNHVEIVSQTAGAVLIGTAGNDLLVADTVGGSTIIGNAGDDCLIGGNAGDQIIGGAGHDTCSNDVGDSTSSCETFL